jgi:hypothetical protein
MVFSRKFYALNLDFARKVQQVSGIPFEQALLGYTNLYVRYCSDYELDPGKPTWRKFTGGLKNNSQDLEWAYQFALQQETHSPAEAEKDLFGCFSYSLWDENRIRLHFHNHDHPGTHPLSPARRQARLDELHALFGAIYALGYSRASVVGGSWLYNIEAYRRLFPAIFLASARPGQSDYPYMTLWGQFLERDGQVRAEPARQFASHFQAASSLDEALDSFPLKVLYLEAPVQVFYDHYRIM